MSEKEFDFEIVTEGSFNDEGFNISTIVIRLNGAALNEYMSLNLKEFFETDEEFEAYKRSQEEKRNQWERKILDQLKFTLDTGYSITQSVREIFTVVLFEEQEENMTDKALNKLSDEQRKYCETMSVIIELDRQKKQKENCERDYGRLRGFLECLLQMKILTAFELRALYSWFSTKDRSQEKRTYETLNT